MVFSRLLFLSNQSLQKSPARIHDPSLIPFLKSCLDLYFEHHSTLSSQLYFSKPLHHASVNLLEILVFSSGDIFDWEITLPCLPNFTPWASFIFFITWSAESIFTKLGGTLISVVMSVFIYIQQRM